MSSETPRRHLSDPRELRALSHPVRLALLELLSLDGPMTATEAGDRLGESPANTSFHLRTLAKYGYVEEAPGGRGRQRPWQIVHGAQEIREDELHGEARLAADALTELMYERHLNRRRTWQATQVDYPGEWRNAGGELFAVFHLTAEELHDLGDELANLLGRFARRESAGERPEGSVPVALLIDSFPLRPPSGQPHGQES